MKLWQYILTIHCAVYFCAADRKSMGSTRLFFTGVPFSILAFVLISIGHCLINGNQAKQQLFGTYLNWMTLICTVLIIVYHSVWSIRQYQNHALQEKWRKRIVDLGRQKIISGLLVLYSFWLFTVGPLGYWLIVRGCM